MTRRGKGFSAAAYAELHRLARARLRGGGDALLDTTCLVHEPYLRFLTLR